MPQSRTALDFVLATAVYSLTYLGRGRSRMARSVPQPRPKKRSALRPTAALAGEVVTVLHAAELPASRIQQIRRRYGDRVEQVIRSHPYRLVQDIAGVSFTQADTVARRYTHGEAPPGLPRGGGRAVFAQCA